MKTFSRISTIRHIIEMVGAQFAWVFYFSFIFFLAFEKYLSAFVFFFLNFKSHGILNHFNLYGSSMGDMILLAARNFSLSILINSVTAAYALFLNSQCKY